MRNEGKEEENLLGFVLTYSRKLLECDWGDSKLDLVVFVLERERVTNCVVRDVCWQLEIDELK